MEARLEAAEM